MSNIDEILLKILRPHPNIQPSDEAFLADPKIIEAKKALYSRLLDVIGVDDINPVRLGGHPKYVRDTFNYLRAEQRKALAELFGVQDGN